MKTRTASGNCYYRFYLFGVRVPYWLYGTVGAYVPYRWRRCEWRYPD